MPSITNSAAELVDTAWREGLAPERQLSVSAWADQHRMLPGASAEPGRWSTARTPYLRDIMDALSVGSRYERVVFVKGAQLGGTEAGLNWLGYIVHNAPGTALLVMASLDMVRRNTRLRIDPMIETTPVLRERIAPPRAKDSNNTAFSKAFPGGALLMAGANSAAGLRSTPARYLFLDEVDAFPSDADGEGDPVDLAVKRTLTFRGKRKILMVSTPTREGESRIEDAFAESDQRLFHLPCPHCDHMHPLEWENIRWPEGRPLDAYATCPSCGGVIEERDKPAMLAAGKWLSSAEGDGRTAGFRLSSLYSPWLSWGEIAAEHERVRSDPPRLQVWTNTVLGQPWAEQGERVEPNGLAARREAFGDELPADIALLTAGVDVQGNRIELSVFGWGAGDESWVVEHRVIWGDPSGPAIWADLDRALARRWRHERAVPDMSIRAAAVDTGGTYTAASYEFCRTRLGRRIWGIKGRGGSGVQLWPRRASRGKGGAPVFTVGVDAAKNILAARLPVCDPGPGCIHFSDELTEEYFAQLTSEQRVSRMVKGRPVTSWEVCAPGIRNEALDCAVYALAALHGLRSQGLDLEAEAEQILRAGLRADGAEGATPSRSWAVSRSSWVEGR